MFAARTGQPAGRNNLQKHTVLLKKSRELAGRDTVFKTAAINHSAIPPRGVNYCATRTSVLTRARNAWLQRPIVPVIAPAQR